MSFAKHVNIGPMGLRSVFRRRHKQVRLSDDVSGVPGVHFIVFPDRWIIAYVTEDGVAEIASGGSADS